MKAGVLVHHVVGRPARAALHQPADLVVQLRIALDADVVVPALYLQQIEQRRDCEGRIGAESPSGPGSSADFACRNMIGDYVLTD